MSGELTCPRCGRPVRRLVVCEDCNAELRGERAARLARTVTGCARALSAQMMASVQVLLSEGRDREAMARAMSAKDAIEALDRAMREVGE